jgi:hypothetical protein
LHILAKSFLGYEAPAEKKASNDAALGELLDMFGGGDGAIKV